MARGFWNIMGEIDYVGQKKAEYLYKVIILVSCLIGFAISCITKQFMYTGYAAMISTIVSLILVVPPWPWYKKNPLTWSSKPKKS
ncbi:SPCS1 [Blepharisma stoltei]|uniref:Signal peptidase complex subunit 1 n=1 Tax=Blepharisma stoltei TaxID=1481888 RepID=A0AAU9IU05_9CILI|nr:unnamed protein product [Blepharisma stoltei]